MEPVTGRADSAASWSASFRFYGALNDFLPAALRQATLVCTFDGRASVKDRIEALGVPHPEVDRLLVNGRFVAFDYLLQDGDRVAAYPCFDSLELGGTGRLGPAPQPIPRFVADVHLGRMAAYLRLAGFDTSYRNDRDDPEIVRISVDEDRLVLTRDVGLLKHAAITRGYFVRATKSAGQLVEVLRRLDLVPAAAPFTRCVRCNDLLDVVSKDRIEHLLPPRTREHYEAFSQCPSCSQVYWQGSHYSRIREFLDTAFDAARAPARTATR